MQYLGYRFDEEEFRHDLLEPGERALMRLRNLAVDLGLARAAARVQTKSRRSRLPLVRRRSRARGLIVTNDYETDAPPGRALACLDPFT